MPRGQHRPLRAAPGDGPRSPSGQPGAPDSQPGSGPTAPGWQIRYVPATGSTNADLVAAAADTASRTALIADEQFAGRGRLGRSWQAPAGSALLLSVLLRPSRVPLAQRGWIGALVGLAAVHAIGTVTGVNATLKWPNDILIDGAKVAGILAESAHDALIAGIGINLTLTRQQLPRPDATSLLLAGAAPAACDRDRLAAVLLTALSGLLEPWYAACGDMATSGLLARYVDRCATIGQDVTVHLPDGSHATGRAIDVRADGALIVDTAAGARAFLAGDVHHLRLTSNR